MSKRPQTSFHPSINIRFDFGKDNVVNRFIPTAAHVHPFQGILSGFISSGQKSHILSGPYGSGKSLVGVVLAGLVLKSFNEATVKQLSKKFDLVDDSVSKLIRALGDTKFSYIPIILEGNIHNLRRSLVSSINKALKSEGISIVMPNLITEILDSVQEWKQYYPETYRLFELQLSKNDQEMDLWVSLIENYNEEAVSWFTNVYPKLTSGSRFTPKFSGDLVSQINYLQSELKKIGKGLFVIHDEFGRFLQALSTFDVHEAMQDLQDLAELANHNDHGNFNLLLISHKNMRQYFLGMSEDLQKEFQRIEKRFCIYHIESDQSTFVRIANLATQDMRSEWEKDDDLTYLQDGLVRHNLFPELTHNEKRSLIVDGAHPLHPITLFAMPKLANIVAQNERTLFTFLESNEFGGLKYHFDKYGGWYTPDKLYDYFEPAFDEFEHESNVKRSYLLFKRLNNRLVPSRNLDDQLKILKLISLWDIASLNTKLVLNKEVISFALMLTKERIQILLDELYEAKIIRFLDDESRFILYEGSIIDVNKEIEQRLRSENFSIQQKLGLATQLLEKKYHLPNHYNDEKSVTRFAEVILIDESEILDEKVAARLTDEADFHIVFVVPASAKQIIELRSRTRMLSTRWHKAIFVVANEPLHRFYHDIQKLLVIDRLQQDKVFLAQDRFLTDELTYIKRSFLYSVTSELAPYINFSEQCDWIYNGQNLIVTDERSLSHNISKILFDLFPYTPEIRNEAFNRRYVAKVQEKNAYKVIDKILEKIRTSGEQIEIGGYGPDYLIYATVLKNNELDPIYPDLVKDEALLQLRNKLINALKKENGSLVDLLEIFRNPPFGVRKPVVPVLLPALLGKEWKYILFYNNGMFMQNIDGETLWKMVYQPENYSFAYQTIDDKYSSLVSLIEECFTSIILEEDRGLQTPVYLSKVLLRWYYSLPRLARVTNKQSNDSNVLRQIIRSSEMRPVESMQQLNSFTGMGRDKVKLVAAKVESENYSEAHKCYLQKTVFNKLDVDSYDSLRMWFDNQSSVVKKTSKLVQSIMNTSVENYIDVITQTVVGVNRNDWSDATDDVFETEVLNELNFIANSGSAVNFIEVNDGIQSLVLPKVQLSTKSKLIYDDISRKLKYTGRTVQKEELLQVLWNLMQEISAGNDIDSVYSANQQGGMTRG